MRALIFRSAVVAAALVLLTGGGSALAGPATTGSVTGTVTAASAALPGVTVYARGVNGNLISQATTDVLGEYSFPTLDPGRYILVFTKHGYATPLPGFAAAGVTAGTNTANVDEALVPGASITGTVKDGSGNPVAGAAIEALDADALNALIGYTLLNGAGATLMIGLYETVIPATITSGLAPSPGATSTAADGTFTVDGLRPGNYLLAANADGRKGPDAQLISIAAAGDAPTADLVMPNGATIHGTVTTADGKPLSGVSVSADSATSAGSSLMSSTPSTVTDASGNYSLTGFGTGDYAVNAAADGLISLDSQAVHVATTTDSLAANFAAPGLGTVTGTVTDATSAPVAGASILLFGMNGYAQGTTDATGKYSIIGLPNDSYDVSLSADGYIDPTDITADITAITQSAVADFSLVHGATIRGIVRTPEGDPVFGATVTARSSDPSVFGYASDVTLPDGSYELSGLDVASYTTTVEATGFAAPAAVVNAVSSRADSITSDLKLLDVSAATPPGKPRVQSMAIRGSIQVLVAAPTSDGGNPITKYTVKAQPGNHSCTTYYSNSCVISHLLDGVLYSVTVNATNEAGTGSAGVTQTWTPAVPIVTSIKAKAGKKGQSLISFKAPKTPNSIVSYKLEYKVKSAWKTYAHPASRSTTILVKGLAAKKAFSGRITTVLKSGRALTSKPFTFKTG
jgi:protocatechuate 3,4-dioxygenase beta subunit